jgi:hypothetical protein
MSPTPTSFSADLLLIRHNPWMMALALSPLLGALGLILAGVAASPIYAAFVPHLTIAGLVLGYIAYRRNWRPRVVPTPVRAGSEGVTVGGRFIPRSEIRDGLVVPGNPPRVRLRRRGGLAVELQTGGADEARGLLRALGLDASQTVAHFRGFSRAIAKRRYSLLAGGGFAAFYVAFFTAMSMGAKHHPGIGATFGLLFLMALITMMVTFLAPTGIDVGADGIALRWLGTRRFYGYDQIDDVSRYEKGWGRSKQKGLRLLLQSGEEVLLPLTGGGSWDDVEVAVIEERIRESVEAFRQGGTAADAALLRRGDRTLGDWIASLRNIGAGANADLRTAPIPRERLFRIVEDPSAPAPARAAAAVALGGEPDDDTRARLRGAAESTAAPRLRVVIEKAAGGDDAGDLEEALREVEAEEESGRAAG